MYELLICWVIMWYYGYLKRKSTINHGCIAFV